jgi:hypothetical protein
MHSATPAVLCAGRGPAADLFIAVAVAVAVAVVVAVAVAAVAAAARAVFLASI